MRAAVIQGAGVKEVELRDDARTVGPDPAEVKVKIKATGVCHSDLSILSGTLPNSYPAVVGHEAAGEVIEVGEHVTNVAPGDHVVISWTPACGLCPDCVAGRPFLCVKYIIEGYTKPRFRLGDDTPAYGMAGCGTWAEEMVVPWEACIKVADDVPYDYAALLGCGISTGVGAVFNTARVRPGTAVAVVGCGGVGLSVIQGARAAGAASILAIDPLESKHEIARRFGATHTATPEGADELRNLLTAGQGFDYAFEVVGRSATIRAAWQLARRGGDVIVVGAGAADDNVRFNAFELLFDGKNLRASLYGGSDLRRDVPRFVDLWRAGKLDLESLITRRIRFEDLNDAIATLERGDAIRQVVLFD
ncbi:Zn-dependent alcohol dehydrogenase [Actinoallomurus acaciae]|uniref:Zn-dependent alcohol dehydrogenase n=1 Tax=Actinoallomurus acaciae TaxID=502577 RepID=A0ABV5YQZ5_9ACTN